MDCYLTSSFMTRFPEKLNQSILKSDDSFLKIITAISNNYLSAGTDCHTLIELLENSKINENAIYKIFSDLEAAGKLKTFLQTEDIPDSVRRLKIGISEQREISTAFTQNADMLLHEKFEIPEWKNKIMLESSKIVIDHDDIEAGNAAIIFSEKSDSLKIGTEFNWEKFLSPHVFPFKKIRILDPYFYKTIKNIPISELFNVLTSKTKGVIDVEIIADTIIYNNGRRDHELEKMLINETTKYIKKNLPNSIKLKLYSQKKQEKSSFHARVLWTDIWAMHFDHGFDFLQSDGNSVKVKWLNLLFQTGKYASRKNLYHEIADNWHEYLKKAILIYQK